MSDYKVGQELPNGVIVDDILNRPGNILPFGFYNPSMEGKLVWMCNNGLEGNEIVSVFSMKFENKKDERDVKYLESMEQALYMRDELIKNGWLPLKLPEIKFSFSGETRANVSKK